MKDYTLSGMEAFTRMAHGATIARECGTVPANVDGVWKFTDLPRELSMRWDGERLLWRVTERDDWECEGGFYNADILAKWRIVPPEESDS